MKKIHRIIKEHLTEIDLHYLKKWLLIGGLVGVVAGLGSIAFFSAISWAGRLFLGYGAGFHPPVPIGEGHSLLMAIGRRWMIPVVTTIGGLISGLIVFKLAPEAEGHGTDAAIEAFHHKEGLIRARIPLIKLVASAITIGSGGSAGREGPTAQIAAGFGSLLGRALKLTVQERRIAVAAGIGAGIGSIFKAPLGGAILSTEILYLEGFEIEALIPSFIASIIGYTIFASWAGYTPIFGDHFYITFDDPFALIYFAVLGAICGLVGILYPLCFYGLRSLFQRLRIPDYYKPAIGGALVGLMGLFLPQVLGMGYGWLQIVMEPQTMLPLELMAVLVFAKIVATSLSIGSGGSGGVFAPGLFIGGMLGAIVWTGLHGIFPHMPPTPEPFVVIGMMALFGGVARAPLAVMFMVGEMAGSYTMLAPAMIAVGISYILVGRHTIYKSQVPSPAESPAHKYEYSFPLLHQLNVRNAMGAEVKTVRGETTAEEALHLLQDLHIKSLPVLNNHGNSHLAGIVTLTDILRTHSKNYQETPVSEIMTTDVISIGPDEPLDTALELMTQHDIASLPVIDSAADSGLLGIINRADVSCSYAMAAKGMLDQIRAGASGQSIKDSVISGGSEMNFAEKQLENEALACSIRTGSEPVAADHATEKAGGSLRVVEVKPGLHEIAEGLTCDHFYRVSWPKEPAHLFGHRGMSGNGKNGKVSGRFVKLSPENITMPERYREASNGLDADETAVFLSTQLGNSRVKIILAGRKKDNWTELLRETATWKELGLSRLDICSF